MRKKIPLEEKKKSINIKIDNNISDLLDEYIEMKEIKNKSKFIDNLINKEIDDKNT